MGAPRSFAILAALGFLFGGVGVPKKADARTSQPTNKFSRARPVRKASRVTAGARMSRTFKIARTAKLGKLVARLPRRPLPRRPATGGIVHARDIVARLERGEDVLHEGCTVKGDLTIAPRRPVTAAIEFKKCTFEGWLRIRPPAQDPRDYAQGVVRDHRRRVVFLGRVIFDGSVFKGYVSIAQAKFFNNLSFDGARFLSSLHGTDNVFFGRVYLSNTTIRSFDFGGLKTKYWNGLDMTGSVFLNRASSTHLGEFVGSPYDNGIPVCKLIDLRKGKKCAIHLSQGGHLQWHNNMRIRFWPSCSELGYESAAACAQCCKSFFNKPGRWSKTSQRVHWSGASCDCQ